MVADKEENKRCKDCGKVKPLSAFYSNRRASPDKVHYSSACRMCISDRNRLNRLRKKATGEIRLKRDEKKTKTVGTKKPQKNTTDKVCTCCGERKSLSEFGSRKGMDGKVYHKQPCKPCANANFHAVQIKIQEKRRKDADKGKRLVRESSPLPPKICTKQPYEGVVVSDIAGKNLIFPPFKGYGFGD